MATKTYKSFRYKAKTTWSSARRGTHGQPSVSPASPRLFVRHRHAEGSSTLAPAAGGTRARRRSHLQGFEPRGPRGEAARRQPDLGPTVLAQHDDGLPGVSSAPDSNAGRCVAICRRNELWVDLNSSSVRTSASTGAPGSPTRRESCATVISVGEGMAASTSNEDMDAMFQPRPHGAIAVGPLRANPQQHGGKVNSSPGARLAS